MATHPLSDEFVAMQGRIALRERALISIAAHLEVRAVLHGSAELHDHGLADVLIGSYARKVSIWPGKDVDVFGRLSLDTITTISPEAAYAMFGRALQPFDLQGRLTPQPRSFNVAYGPHRQPNAQFVRAAGAAYRWDRSEVERIASTVNAADFEFSVDVVPAVGWASDYGIPEVGQAHVAGERIRTGDWRRTNPVRLTELTQELNKANRVGRRGAYVPTVKAIKQVKAHHLHGVKPSALYYEFILYEGFSAGLISGQTWAGVTASALQYIIRRLDTAATDPVRDPVLQQAYMPLPDEAALAFVRDRLNAVARRAQRALVADSRCQAAIEWQGAFGANAKFDQVFRLPNGCRGDGTERGVVAAAAAGATVATGGTSERSFGER